MSGSVFFFYLCGDVYKFTRDHATQLNFYKPSRVFYITSTYNKTTTDCMKYSSKMAENRVYEIFNSVLKKKKLNKHGTEQSKKLSDLKKTTIKAILKKLTQLDTN